jgi:hypothetical protein
MLKKFARLVFPEIRIRIHGTRAEAFLNGQKVYFDFDCASSESRVLKNAFLAELIQLKRTYLTYSLIKPKLVIDLTEAAGSKIVLKEAIEKALKRFDHLLAGLIDGRKKMIL